MKKYLKKYLIKLINKLLLNNNLLIDSMITINMTDDYYLREYEEQQTKNRIQEKKKQQSKNDNIITSNLNSNFQKSYGYMWYKISYEYGIGISNYKIYKTSSDLATVIDNLKQKIKEIWSDKYFSKCNFLVYEIGHINPKLVSYDIIESSEYPTVKICINKNEREYNRLQTRNTSCLTIYGEKNLLKKIKDFWPNLVSYQLRTKKINNMESKIIKIEYKKYYKISKLASLFVSNKNMKFDLNKLEFEKLFIKN